jgi:hypothetical protein
LGGIDKGQGGLGLGFLDQRTDPVDAFARIERATERVDNLSERAI